MRGYNFLFVGLIVLFSGLFNTVLAAPNVYVSTDINTPIDIAVSLSEVGINSVTADSPTAQGGTVTVGGTPSAPIFTYTPASGFTGGDTFVYRLFDAGNALIASATVTVQVGALNRQIDSMCTSVGGQAPTSLVAFCSDFSIATPAERATILREVSPLELGGQIQMSALQASQQIDNIRHRLSSLRQSISGAGALSGLHLNWNNRSYAINDMLADERGGAAAADSSAGKNLSYFVNGSFGGTSHDQSSYEDGYSMSNRALTAGSDYRINNNLVAGAAVGSSNSGMEIDSSGGDVSTSGVSLLAYTSYYLTPRTYIEGVWAMHKNSLDSTRNINYSVQGVSQHESASSDTDNTIYSISVGTGYETYFNQGVTLTVSANVDNIQSGFDGYAESGAGDKNLVVNKRQFSQTTYILNSKLTKAISLPTGVLIPQMDFNWKHEFEKDAQEIKARFRADPSKSVFAINTEAPDSDYFQLNLGASYIVPGGNTGFMYYEKTLGKTGYSTYSLSLGLRLNF